MTAPSFRAAGTLQAVTTGAVGGALPGSMTNGEIVLSALGIFGGGADEDVAPVWSAGNNEAPGNPWNAPLGDGIKKRINVGSDFAAGAFLKLYTASWVNPSMSVDDSDTQAKYCTLAVFNNPDPTTGNWWEGADWSHGPASGLRTGPTIVTTGPNRYLVQVFALVDDGAVALDATDPGWTILNNQSSAVSFDARIVIVGRTAATAGSYSGAVITKPDTNTDHWVCIGFAMFGGADEPAGAQDIVGALFANTNTVYGSTVGRGAVGIDGTLVADADTIQAATVSRGVVDIAGALVSDADTFHQATVARADAVIAEIAHTNQVASTGTSLTVTKPPGTASGHLLLTFFTVDQAGYSPALPSGFTLIDAIENGGRSLRAAYKVAGGSEPADYTFTWSTSDQAIAFMIALSGVKVSGPIGAFASASNASLADYPFPAINTTAPNSRVFGCYESPTGGDVTSGTGWTAGFTSGEDVNQGTNIGAGWGWLDVPTSGTNVDTTFNGPTQITASMLVEVLVDGDGQSIVGATFANSASIPAATVTPGAVDVTGALVADADVVHAATVAATVGISGGLVTDADTVHAATLAATSPITGALVSDGDTVYGATLTPGTVSVAAALYADPDTIRTATVAPGGMSITGGLYADPDVTYAATVAATSNIAGALFADADVIQGATVSAVAAIVAALVSDADVAHAATIGRGLVNVAGALVSDPDTVYSAIVSAGGSNVIGSLYADPDTTYGATIGRGSVGIVGALYQDADIVPAAVIGRGAVGISGALYADADAFHVATIGRGAVNIAAALAADADLFHAALIAAGPISITAALVTDPDGIFAANIGRGAVNVAAALYSDPDTVPIATIGRGAVNVAGGLYADADAVFAALVASVANVSGSPVVDPDAFFTALIAGGTIGILASRFDDPDIVYSATVAIPAHVLMPSRVNVVGGEPRSRLVGGEVHDRLVSGPARKRIVP